MPPRASCESTRYLPSRSCPIGADNVASIGRILGATERSARLTACFRPRDPQVAADDAAGRQLALVAASLLAARMRARDGAVVRGRPGTPDALRRRRAAWLRPSAPGCGPA